MTALPRSNAFRASLTAVRRGHLTHDSGQPDRLTAAIDASTRERQPLTAAIDASTLTRKSYRLWVILRRACPFLLTIGACLRIVFSQLEAPRRHKAEATPIMGIRQSEDTPNRGRIAAYVLTHGRKRAPEHELGRAFSMPKHGKATTPAKADETLLGEAMRLDANKRAS